VGFADHSSYHLPLVGAGRNSWDAWQRGKPWSAAGHAGLFGVEALGMRSAGKVRGIVRGGGKAKGAAKATVKVAKVKGSEVKGLVPGNVTFSNHAFERLAQRGITKKMADVTINKGLKFYDPKNESINYVLKGTFGSGKDILIATNPLTGEVCTVLRGSNLVKPRMLPIE
jgi:hypothetical protein